MLPVGVALSGGTAKSVTHVGALKALTEAEIPIDHLAATSGGSIVGALFASGTPMSTMLQVANEMSWGKLITIRLSRLGIVSSKRIEDFVRSMIGDVHFADMKVPFSVVATDLATGHKHVFNKGNVAHAVRASCSIPQIFLPVEIDGKYYVDGGVSEYLPVQTLQELGDMFVIAIHLAHDRSYHGRPRNYLQMAIHVMGLVSKTNYVVSEKKADVLVHPNMDRFSSFDFDSSEQMIELGYTFTKSKSPEIMHKWRRKSNRMRRLWKKLPIPHFHGHE